jgi:ankyrin repeat protein
VKLLLAHGADAESKNKDGKSPLSYAAWNVGSQLLATNSNVKAEEMDGWMPIF